MTPPTDPVADVSPGAHPGGNRLGDSTSPYLLQHAHNPVDWREWGPDAFEEARRRNVPIFLSVGYATCYWCHVMERESFENTETGRLMSELFVCVKVDREERPDVDDLYMNATQLMTGHGGWPMSVFLEPAGLRPFFCGTYFPAEPRGGMPSFRQVLRGMSDAWKTQHAEVLEQSEQLADGVVEQLATRTEPRALGSEEVTTAVTQLLRMFDATHGGFGSAPKFPQPSFVDLLLEARTGAGDNETREVMDRAVRTTLDRMAIGGLRDQVGGGFHRYSVDETWTVPHFEKMLYDNAQLAVTYARAAMIYDDDYYRQVVRETLDYVLLEMRHERGGFFSAQDAEVNGREGLNYLWLLDELSPVLGEEDAAWAAEVYGVARGPNFKDPHHADEPARSILRLNDRPERIAVENGLTPSAVTDRLRSVNERLYDVRGEREQPRLDDKILAGWNGLMIAGFAAGAEALGDEAYLDAGERALAFVLDSLWTGGDDGALIRSWRDGRAGSLGFLEDAAFVLSGAVELARVQRAFGRSESETLAFARRILAHAERDFAAGDGGYFDTRADQSDLFVRARTTYDGALPSGGTQMALSLVRFHALEPTEGHLDRAAEALRSVSADVSASPLATAVATRAVYAAIRAGLAPQKLEFAAREARVEPASAPNPVQVFAEVERVSLSSEEPASFRVMMRIEPGYHIIAASPAVAGEESAAEGLIPLRAGLIGGSGVRVYADYPAGEPYGVEGVGRVSVLSGEIEFDIALERVGDWSGRPLVTLTFQACNDSACFPPRTVELDVALDPTK